MAPHGEADELLSYGWGPSSSAHSRDRRAPRVSVRQFGGGIALAVLIALATALADGLIGSDRGVPGALTTALRLGDRGQLAVHLAYYTAAGLAAAASLVVLAVFRQAVRQKRRARPVLVSAAALAVVLGCFVAPDFAIGRAPLGAYTSRGAYQFISAPALHPPIVHADITRPGQLAKGYILIANFYNPLDRKTMVGQSGPLILDQQLSPVWFMPVSVNDLAANLSLQTYEGRPVLAWWQGQIKNTAIESGEYVVVDQHYRRVAALHGAGGWMLSMHDIVIRGGDAWVTASKNVSLDLSRYSGPRHGTVIDSAVQEYNLKSGRLLRSWDALTHIPLSDSWIAPPTHGPWDAYHVNSIELPGDGSLIVSMRNTWAGYKVDIASGRIDWTLGGKHSSFGFGSGAEFQWQHDVEVYPGTPYVTVFDDHCCQVTRAGRTIAPREPSRGVVLRLNPATRMATLVDQYVQAARVDSEYMGSIQPLSNGNEFVGWGSNPHFSEFTATGRMLLDACLPGPDIDYRASVEPWVGLPLDPPSGAARSTHGQTSVYASWNGATEVSSWRVLAGSSSGNLAPVTTAAKAGFETSIPVVRSYRVFRLQALDARGRVLGVSAPFATT